MLAGRGSTLCCLVAAFNSTNAISLGSSRNGIGLELASKGRELRFAGLCLGLAPHLAGMVYCYEPRNYIHVLKRFEL